MTDEKLIEKITDLVRDYGTDKGFYTSIDLANQSLHDPDKVVQDIDYHKEKKRAEITFEWFDEETGDVRPYSNYPIDNLDTKDLEELLDLVEFATADLRPSDD